ncbi:MAG: hydrogenase/urease maturation nickel metallochaperone HypA [Candidatus Omnitrophica bacterium]|nr:hydrogenase/urease maturation nickel metallochaperone HypA [Candidatus Omnitrophota bacterium]
MHEAHLIENILQYLNQEEKQSSKRVRKIYISLSEFGGVNEAHFKEQYKKESAGTKWETLEIEIKKIPYGKELEITQLDFE